ncbi:hypothetical protein [Stutzerimonas zhaodongensis]|uniref:hypothetical protein n=1 Tax=Stutzerimonas TaxID=2901164 RepID=UPI00388D2ED1
MHYRQTSRIAIFALALLSLAVLALKDSPTSELYVGADKLYHWIGFSVLTYTAHLAFPRVRLGSLFVWILIGGASIELLQALSPFRTPSLADLTINIVGILTGLGATQLKQADQKTSSRRQRRSSGRRRRRRIDDERLPKDVS